MQRQRFSNAKSGLKIQVVIGLLVLGAVTVASAAAANAGRAPGEETAMVSYLATGRVGFQDPENAELAGRVSLQESAVFVPFAQMGVKTITLAAAAWAGWTRLDFRDHPDLDSEDLYGLAACLGAEYRVCGNFWIRAAGGVDFDRRYKILDNGRTLLDDEVNDTAFLSLALVLY